MKGRSSDVALLALRAALGIGCILHGYPEAMHPSTWFGALEAFVELAGGIAVLAGFATSTFAFLIGCDMAGAIFFGQILHGGAAGAAGRPESLELRLAYLAIALALILLGPGAFAAGAPRGSPRQLSRRRR